ncbi:MAG TPA: DUF2079 domain-containing protein [Bacteroidia bacterium]|jgi:uncharacterized membrane protein
MSSIFRKPIHFILLVFGFIFCSISLVNHYNFRTFAFDLGLFNNQLYDYAHFRMNDYSLMKEAFSNALADHFSLITPLVSPLYWIFGSYTMLLVQIFFLLFGGYGIYVYFKSRKPMNTWLAEMAAVHYFSFWALYSALGFDYHENVVAASLVPWFIYYFEQQKHAFSIWCLVLILIAKENMALWAVFISLGLAIIHRKERNRFFRALLYSGIAAVYFVTVVKFIMPSLGTNHPELGYHHFKYSSLGKNFGEAMQTIFLHPLHFIKLFFVNHLGDPDGDGIKRELYITLLLSGGFIFILRPAYAVMILPIIAQKVLSDDFGKWGINYHYSIELAPITCIALFNWIDKGTSVVRTAVITTAVLISTGLSTFYKLEYRVSKWYDPLTQQFYNPAHYKCEFDRKKLHEMLALIPDTAAVSASTQLVPRLAFRRDIYEFPIVDNASYVAVTEGSYVYPLTAYDFKKQIQDYLFSMEWEVLYAQSNIYLFHKKHLTSADVEKEGISGGLDADTALIADIRDKEFFGEIKLDDARLKAHPLSHYFAWVNFRSQGALPPGAVFLVASLEDEHGSYNYQSSDLSASANGQVDVHLITADLRPNSTLKFYIWNKGKVPVSVGKISVGRKGKKMKVAE